MNKDSVKGTIDDAAGRVRRQVGEWTDNTEEQVKGAAQQIKGKAEKAAGKARDAVGNATNKADHSASVNSGNNAMDNTRDREELDRGNHIRR
jgi:uncharacterized protein YjbJ (UPF0337 family)